MRGPGDCGKSGFFALLQKMLGVQIADTVHESAIVGKIDQKTGDPLALRLSNNALVVVEDPDPTTNFESSAVKTLCNGGEVQQRAVRLLSSNTYTTLGAFGMLVASMNSIDGRVEVDAKGLPKEFALRPLSSSVVLQNRMRIIDVGVQFKKATGVLFRHVCDPEYVTAEQEGVSVYRQNATWYAQFDDRHQNNQDILNALLTVCIDAFQYFNVQWDKPAGAHGHPYQTDMLFCDVVGSRHHEERTALVSRDEYVLKAFLRNYEVVVGAHTKPAFRVAAKAFISTVVGQCGKATDENMQQAAERLAPLFDETHWELYDEEGNVDRRRAFVKEGKGSNAVWLANNICLKARVHELKELLAKEARS
jgi:hypothetical protein